MFLKSVELEGFKSFAENTRVEFTDGFTAIFGPNRCGKHNFIEAITWALGISDDDGDSADDVIFRGTEQYAKSACAKVTLTLADETKITRSISQTGENNFFINEKATSKSEVLSLLENAGLPNGERVVITQDFVQEFAQNTCDKTLSRTEKMIEALSSILSSDKNLLPIYFLDRVDVLFDEKKLRKVCRYAA